MNLMRPVHKIFTGEFKIPRACWISLALLIGSALSRAQSSNTPAAAPNFSTFSKFITERNIFNPNRYPHAPNTPYVSKTRIVRHNSFGLAGTMSYDEGETPGLRAFFDGTSAEYRKALETGGSIAVFKITAIMPDSVTLLSNSNSLVLKIGQQIHDDGQGHWTLSTTPVSFAAVASSSGRNGRRSFRGQRGEGGDIITENSDTNSIEGMPDNMADQGDAPPDTAEDSSTDNAPVETITIPAGPASDALRRLMEIRAQEEQQQSGNRN